MFQQLSRHYRCFSHRLVSAAATATLTARSMSTVPFYQLSAKDIKGQDFAFSQLQGKVVLVVNVASKVRREYRGTVGFQEWPVWIPGSFCIISHHSWIEKSPHGSL